MQMVKKGILVFMVILLSLAIFSPKREIYYLFEDELMKNGIIIDDEEINDGLLSLTISHPKIYLRGVLIADVEKIRLWTIFFYTRLAIGHIKVDSSLDKFIPSPILKLQASYSVTNPLKVSLLATGDFENVNGAVYLESKTVHIDISDKKLINKYKSQLRKGENGWYYETSF
ncbi:hypothetical protein MNB_SV-9-1536 [hydrothermal vent metagenome]|uniref:Uncharacterized protein n=1 Tax=hydrothermal vent metagenome TaxID=652676 RepID=A0A1W1BGC3_9ZZZZ